MNKASHQKKKTVKKPNKVPNDPRSKLIYKTVTIRIDHEQNGFQTNWVTHKPNNKFSKNQTVIIN